MLVIAGSASTHGDVAVAPAPRSSASTSLNSIARVVCARVDRRADVALARYASRRRPPATANASSTEPW